MRIVLLAAMDRNRAIGKDGEMPWHISTDLKRFKQRSMGLPLIMGRSTFESIGKPLPGRTNIVLTRNVDWSAEGVSVAHNTESALELAWAEGAEEVCIIGGGQIYALFLGRADILEITLVDTEVKGADTWFPDWRGGNGWSEVAREDLPAGENDEFPFAFVTMVRQ